MAKKKRKKQPPLVERGLPEAFLSRLGQILPEQVFSDVVNALSFHRPVVFRVHRPDVTPGRITDELRKSGLDAKPVSWNPQFWVLQAGGIRELQNCQLYQQGLIYIQGLSSLFVPLVLDPQPGEKVLDLCAAPGSKTTQMALMMKGEGELLANELNRARFFKLKAIADAQGMRNVRLHCSRGEGWGRRFPEQFDRVLLDVPCSSEGRFTTEDPDSFRFWKPRKVTEMARKQKPLLLSAFSCLKPGGVLVYSTCTFAPEENEAVLAWGLERFGPAAELEEIEVPFSNVLEGLAGWKEVSWDSVLKRSKRILPSADMEAFFIARIRKKHSWQWVRRERRDLYHGSKKTAE